MSNDVGDMRAGPFLDRSIDDFRALLEAFSIYPARLALEAIPQMKIQDGGRILFVTSGAPLNPTPGMSMYTAARAAANTLVKSLAKEYGADNISVNGLAPFYAESSYLPMGMDDPSVAEHVRAGNSPATLRKTRGSRSHRGITAVWKSRFREWPDNCLFRRWRIANW